MTSRSLEELNNMLYQTELKIDQLKHELNNAEMAKIFLLTLIDEKRSNNARESTHITNRDSE